jgi:hypothetical protein
MISMIKYLSFFSLTVVFALLYILSHWNPHPKNLKSDTEYAKSKNYTTDYDSEDLEEKNITPNLSIQKQRSIPHSVPIEVKIPLKKCGASGYRQGSCR